MTVLLGEGFRRDRLLLGVLMCRREGKGLIGLKA